MEELRDGIRRVTLPLPTRPGHVHAYLLPERTAGRWWTPGSACRRRRRPGRRSSSKPAVASRPSSSRTSTPTTSAPLPISTSSPERPSSRGRSTTRSASSSGETRHGRNGSCDWFRLHGAPDDVTAELAGQSSVYRPFIRYQRDPILVVAGEHVDGWELIAAPGHADGQLCLLRDGVLVAADHLLGRITPTVGLWPASRPDPLGDYLAALDRTIELEPRIALPGHGEPIEDPTGRARELKEHHRLRLEEAVAALTPRAADRLRAVVRALRRRSTRGRTPLRGRRDAVAPRASRAGGRGSSAGGRRGGYLYCRLIIVGDEIPPSTGAPDGA